mmetsp:Transcript_2380/g.3441  ORF Transcript_2380/g.3441 Transcript_2380/m.3441 type:complete len:505 (+) Transcript_2380:131-1645(+)
MGFPTDDILETGSLHKEFECGICLNLVEYPSYTACSHVFCKGCLQEWLAQKQDCPKCKRTLTSGEDVVDLKQAAPLAWRILCRVRVRCPLHNQDCKWKGDYGDLNEHLTSSKTHTIDESTPGAAKRAMARASAEAFKEQGNQQFRARAYDRAIVLYSKAISLAPEMFNVFANRSAAYLQLQKYENAVEDARSALKLNPNYVRGHQRLAGALMEMGEFRSAANHLAMYLAKLPELGSDHQKALQLAQGMSDGEAAMKEGKYMEARQIFNAISGLSKSVTPVLMGLRAELSVGLCANALRSCLQILKQRSKCIEAYVVRAWAFYLSKEFDQSLKHCREALRLDPDFSEARVLYKKVKLVYGAFQDAREAFSKRNFQESVEHFSKAIENAKVSTRAPVWASLHSQRAQAYRRLKQWTECLRDCKIALEAADDNKQAWITRASCLIELGRPEEAEIEMKNLLDTTFQNDTIVRHMRDKAEFEVRKRKRPDYYKILGIPSISSEPEIKV